MKAVIALMRFNKTASIFELNLYNYLSKNNFNPEIIEIESASPLVDGYTSNKFFLASKLLNIFAFYRWAWLYKSKVTSAYHLVHLIIPNIRLLLNFSQLDKTDINDSSSRFLLQSNISNSILKFFVSTLFHFTCFFSKLVGLYISSKNPDLVYMSHGVYSTWGPLRRYLDTMNITYVCWGLQYRKNSIVAAHCQPTRESLIQSTDYPWPSLKISQKVKTKILKYILSKQSNSSHFDRVNYYSKENTVSLGSSALCISKILSSFASEKTFVLFPNITWDAKSTYIPYHSNDQLDWIKQTLDFFNQNPDYLLIIRSHPAETRGNARSNERISDFIINKLNPCSNTIILGPDSSITSYDILNKCQNVIVFASKIGLEAALLGKKVITGSTSHYSRKGFTIDPLTLEEYYSAISNISSFDIDEYNLYAFGYYYHFLRQLHIGTMASSLDKNSHLSSEISSFVQLSLQGSPFMNKIQDA